MAIDDNEVHRAQLVLDEVFGEDTSGSSSLTISTPQYGLLFAHGISQAAWDLHRTSKTRRYKTEVIHCRAPWRSLHAVEYATLEWVDWFNNRRLPELIGSVPPAELELAYYRQKEESAEAA